MYIITASYIHNEIKKLYLLNVVELTPSIWDCCYIMSISLTVPGIELISMVSLTIMSNTTLNYVDMVTIIQ